MYTPACSIQRLAELQTPGTGRREAGGIWWVVFGGWHVVCRVADGGQLMVAEIVTSVDIIVWTLSLAQPPRQDLTMPHSHHVNNCSLRFCKRGSQLDLGESRSLTEIFQRNLVPASHRLWEYVCAFSLGLMEMMAMAMAMAMVMAITMAMVVAMVLVIVIVIIVPEVLR